RAVPTNLCRRSRRHDRRPRAARRALAADRRVPIASPCGRIARRMRKLILVKHAAPHVMPGVPPEKWRLSDKGKSSCATLAEAIRPDAPAVIVASEEPKAAETAELLAAALSVPFETM